MVPLSRIPTEVSSVAKSLCDLAQSRGTRSRVLFGLLRGHPHPGRKAEPYTGTAQPQGENSPPWGLLAASPRHDAMREPGSLFCLRLLPPDDQTLAGSSSGTITFCAVPVISMQRHVEGRCGTEFGPLKVS